VRRYGFTAKLKISVLSNFEYLALYDCSQQVSDTDDVTKSRIKLYHYTEYEDCFDQIRWQIGQSGVYNGSFDVCWQNIEEKLKRSSVDSLFLEQINSWRVILTASYYNSLSLAFAEICGRSHGGGVLELMPSETEDILLPYNANNAVLLPYIDEMIREKRDISEILTITNKQILKENYGFSADDIRLSNSIWTKLSGRRLNRGRK